MHAAATRGSSHVQRLPGRRLRKDGKTSAEARDKGGLFLRRLRAVRLTLLNPGAAGRRKICTCKTSGTRCHGAAIAGSCQLRRSLAAQLVAAQLLDVATPLGACAADRSGTDRARLAPQRRGEDARATLIPTSRGHPARALGLQAGHVEAVELLSDRHRAQAVAACAWRRNASQNKLDTFAGLKRRSIAPTTDPAEMARRRSGRL